MLKLISNRKRRRKKVVPLEYPLTPGGRAIMTEVCNIASKHTLDEKYLFVAEIEPLIADYRRLYGGEGPIGDPKTAALSIFLVCKLIDKMGIKKADETLTRIYNRVRMKALPGGKEEGDSGRKSREGAEEELKG